ncbi:anthranilate synthase component I family protein [Methanobrevibacter filiformis]|uniref:Anthranilate synthase component 1 n=1 Tax=Methanobrevibacter filiformis TaxID=55758 RepID=A0A165ZS71_9EURY|nr:anthranilate synthase component 1 [Methanobrevibacter filiformis]
MIFPSLKQSKTIINQHDCKNIPIGCEILSDIKTPMEVLKILKENNKHCFMLESVENLEKWGRYTIIGFDPILEITCENSFLQIKGYKNLNKTTKNPGKYIREIIHENRSPSLPEFPPFTGGLVGYFAYDYIKYSESSLNFDQDNSKNQKLKSSFEKSFDESFKDVDLMLFDKVIVFDNFKQKMILIANIKVENIEEEYKKAVFKLKKLINLIKNDKSNSSLNSSSNNSSENNFKLKGDFKPLFSKEKYSKMVDKVKNYIKEGDVFQVVLSNPLSCEIQGSLLDTYRILRTTNPSPYMFYFSSEDIEIAGASPETLVKLHNRQLYTFPLAGTRPRGGTEEEDKKLEKELLSDEKELAEHNMLVDLGRNDIGKISEFGSVKLDKYLSIEKFSHVMHIGSTVTGKLRKDKDYLDVIDAILPAGTLSGAPKIRACEIINELESNKRGIYGGAIGYISLSGNVDTCIAIRIAFSKNNRVFIRSGAGIVADSVPEKEFDECMNKAKAVLNALKLSEDLSKGFIINNKPPNF